MNGILVGKFVQNVPLDNGMVFHHFVVQRRVLDVSWVSRRREILCGFWGVDSSRYTLISGIDSGSWRVSPMGWKLYGAQEVKKLADEGCHRRRPNAPHPLDTDSSPYADAGAPADVGGWELVETSV